MKLRTEQEILETGIKVIRLLKFLLLNEYGADNAQKYVSLCAFG